MRRRASSPIHAFPPSRPLGLPFLGRSNELNRLSEAMTEGAGAGVVVVRGPAGAGKSRLARYLSDHDEHRRGRRVSFVTCRNGEPASAVQARAERRLGVLPGDLFTALRDEHCLLVVDDLHHLTASATEHLLAPIDGAPLRGRVLLVSRDLPALQRDLRPLVLDLGGLDDDAARALWEHMESAHGPTRQGTCDHALQMSRGLPLALRRAYAEAVFGPDAWGREALSPAAAAVLDALTVLGRPAGPGAIATMLTEADAFGPAHDPAGAPEGAIELADGFHALVARQLIDQLDDGRFATHVALRGDLLDALPTPRRRRLERAAAARVGTSTAGHGGQDHSLGVLDPVDRVCAEVRHLLAAGDWSEAAHCLLIRREALFEGGGGGELEGLVELLRRCAGAEHQLELAMLDQLQAELAADRGDVSRALALDPGTDPVATAALRFRAGQVREARNTLEDLLAACAEDASPSTGALSPDIRCRAAVHLAELVLADGDPDAAERIVATAFARDHAAVSEPLRARLHLALAAIARHRGHVDSARAALARAAGAGRLAPALRARIEIQRAACLIDEGRLRDAHDALTRAEHDARAVDAGAVADEARLHASRLAALRGDTERAIELLRALARAHRRRGDEIGGIAAEHALAALHLRRGDRSAAAECARAARRSATRLGLQGLAAGAAAVEATLDALDLREDAAAPLAALVRDPAVDATGRHTAAQALDWYLAATGQPPNPELLGCNDDGDSPDDLAARLVEARVARARGKQDRARKLADEIASRAERGGRRAELAHALNLSARLALARGQRSRATAAATRAAREAEASGLADALIESRLVLASLALAEGRTADAVDHARAGADLAARTGLNLLRAVAIEALSALDPNTSADDLEAARATLSAPCIELAGHLSADLGLSAARPYCLLTATGARTRVADTDPARLRLDARSLVIDRVHEVILRDGNQIADLRRRSLLKRLLYLFAAAPGRSFSKETIVETVWEVEYHPLRHDAALFTNIMRARRLLGEDGAEIIRVSDDGYRLAPPDDFLYIEAAQDQSA